MSGPSKEQFFRELNEETFCGYQWCKKLYGYAWSDPKFLERVYNRLDELGRDKVKYIFGVYLKTQKDYELSQDKQNAKYVRERIDRKYEKEVEDWKKESLRGMKGDQSWMNGMF